MPIIKIENTKQIQACIKVIQYLRDHLDEAQLREQIPRQMIDGYQLHAFQSEDGEFTSFVGFRVLEALAWGKFIYVDDLATHPDYQGKGHARQLLLHVIEIAKAEGCQSVQLDSGFARHDAHRLYLNVGFQLHYQHFKMDV